MQYLYLVLKIINIFQSLLKFFLIQILSLIINCLGINYFRLNECRH